MPSHRIPRVESQLRREISDIFGRFIKDPRVQMATVTEVKVSRDLRHARVFVSIIGDRGTRLEVLMTLRHAARSVRMEVGRRVRMRRVPELVFELDDTVDRSMRIGEILDSLEKERGDRGAEPSSGGSRDDGESSNERDSSSR